MVPQELSITIDYSHINSIKLDSYKDPFSKLYHFELSNNIKIRDLFASFTSHTYEFTQSSNIEELAYIRYGNYFYYLNELKQLSVKCQYTDTQFIDKVWSEISDNDIISLIKEIGSKLPRLDAETKKIIKYNLESESFITINRDDKTLYTLLHNFNYANATEFLIKKKYKITKDANNNIEYINNDDWSTLYDNINFNNYVVNNSNVVFCDSFFNSDDSGNTITAVNNLKFKQLFEKLVSYYLTYPSSDVPIEFQINANLEMITDQIRTINTVKISIA